MEPNEDDLNKKLNDAVSQMMDRIDKTRLRSLQRETYLRMAACFDSETASSQSIQNCTERSSHGIQQIHRLLDNEMKNFQSKLQRCGQVCQDEATDAMSYSSSPNKEYEATEMLRKCSARCVDKHIDMLKSLEGQIIRNVDQIAKK